MTEKAAHILGCRFDALTEDQVVEQIFRWCDQADGQSRTIVTVNVAILMMMRKDPRLARAIARADLVLADGMPLVWASRWLGTPVPERVTGVDLMRRLLRRGQSRGLRIFLLGTTEPRLATLRQTINDQFAGVVIAGARNGYFQPDDHAEVTRAIRGSNADLLLVGMPAPFKEIWCEEQRGALGTAAILGVGGAFDVMAGFIPRAPTLLQQLGLEWAWRLAMDPAKLWKRYLVTNSQFVGLLLGLLVTGAFSGPRDRAAQASRR